MLYRGLCRGSSRVLFGHWPGTVIVSGPASPIAPGGLVHGNSKRTCFHRPLRQGYLCSALLCVQYVRLLSASCTYRSARWVDVAPHSPPPTLFAPQTESGSLCWSSRQQFFLVALAAYKPFFLRLRPRHRSAIGIPSAGLTGHGVHANISVCRLRFVLTLFPHPLNSGPSRLSRGSNGTTIIMDSYACLTILLPSPTSC